MDTLADLVLYTGSESIIIFGFLIAYWWGAQRDAMTALVLLLFTVPYNTLLKNCFQVPLPEAIQSTHSFLAFPSGHTHSFVVFWGWLAWTAQRKWAWTTLYLIVLPFFGWSLVQKGFHYPSDVFSAVGFGWLTLGVARCLESRSVSRSFLHWGLFSLAYGMSVLLPMKSYNLHVWPDFLILCGIVSWDSFLARRELPIAEHKCQI